SSIIDWNVPLEADLESAWLFPCYYYDDIKEEGEADAIVGEYEFVSHMAYGDETKVGDQKEIGWDDEKQESIMGTVTKADYKLVVDKNNKFTIYESVNDEYEKLDGGSWSKTDGVYSFTIPSPWGGDPIAYTVTFNSETGEITLNDSDEEIWKFILKAQA
ncbi:MAG: hypothetical protein K2O67_00215, partial [Clostridia bacterium]|nr:hypothetical protein [Clostridia bacterium]